jgi:hypothetical protein
MGELSVRSELDALTLATQVGQLRGFGETLVKSGLLPQSIKTPEAAVVIILKGRELGIPPMEALNSISVIQGKPTVSPQLMLALIYRSGLGSIQILERTDSRSIGNSDLGTFRADKERLEALVNEWQAFRAAKKAPVEPAA